MSQSVCVYNEDQPLGRWAAAAMRSKDCVGEWLTLRRRPPVVAPEQSLGETTVSYSWKPDKSGYEMVHRI